MHSDEILDFMYMTNLLENVWLVCRLQCVTDV